MAMQVALDMDLSEGLSTIGKVDHHEERLGV